MASESIVSRVKRLTPKQWALIASGGIGAALLINYVYAKEDSVVMRLWRKLHGAPALPPPRVARPAPPSAHAPHARVQPQGMPMPMPPTLPPSAVLVEPTIMFEGYVPGYFPHQFFPHSHFGHYGFGHHHVGAPPEEAPGAPRQTRTKVPPPGSRGVVSVTPPAASDPGASGHLHETSSGEQPCGAGLYYDATAGMCVPYPTTGPVTSGQYDWE